MRLLLPFFVALSLSADADPAITQVKAVYLMPMGSGLDQYLATELIRERVFDVVTDPALADAVLTDRIGAGFEQALAELYPPPPAPPAEEKAAAAPAAEKTVGESMAERPEVARRASSFSRGRGNVYLVDRRTKRVLWSDFRRPKTGRAEEVHRAAGKLVDQLQADLGRLRNPQK
jgi:hypothetical protein